MTPKKPPKAHNDGKGESMEWSFVGADQLILMMKVHKKIFVFRDIMDLAPLHTSASLSEVLIHDFVFFMLKNVAIWT